MIWEGRNLSKFNTPRSGGKETGQLFMGIPGNLLFRGDVGLVESKAPTDKLLPRSRVSLAVGLGGPGWAWLGAGRRSGKEGIERNLILRLEG